MYYGTMLLYLVSFVRAKVLRGRLYVSGRYANKYLLLLFLLLLLLFFNCLVLSVVNLKKEKLVSKLVFYAQSAGAVISGRYISHIVYLIFNNVYVLKWVYRQ